MMNRVFITGASSGIGTALALASARAGAELHLCGRDEVRLAAVAARCEASGARVRVVTADVRDAPAMAAAIRAAGVLDLVIANAGISVFLRPGARETERDVRDTFAIDVDGVVNTVLPAWDVMKDQAPGPGGVRGRIAAIASVAGFAPLPIAPAYSAAKAAVDTWIVASAPAARRDGVRLTSVCPGFIHSPMTAEMSPAQTPAIMDADRAARLILAGISRGRVRVVFPKSVALLSRAVGLLPPQIGAALLARAPR